MSDPSPHTGSNPRGRAYWRSLDEFADTPEFKNLVAREFPSMLEEVNDPVSRRKFLGLMGAAVALSGVVGCRRPLAKILPYTRMPEDLLPGVPQQYASVMPFRGVAEGILVTSNEGRPTKIEGNPDHPSSLGATHVWAQAATLELYDPDRSKNLYQGPGQRTWQEFASWIRPRLDTHRAEGGAGLRFLMESSSSPSLAAMREEMSRAYPEAKWHVYEPLNRDGAIEGARIAFGRPLRAQLHLDQADVILSLDSDFLYTEPNSVRHARDFASRRRVASERDTMNRLYAVESPLSVTGTMADHRLRLPHARVADFALALAGALASRGVAVVGADGGAAAGASKRLGEDERKFLNALAADLVAHRGRSVVLAGSGQPAEVHALAHAMNAALGNVGPVVRYTEEPETPHQTGSLRDLAGAMDRGEVKTLFILGGNPVYDAPADVRFAERLAKVPASIHLGLYRDETGSAASWHLPKAHFLESWGDGRAWDGTLSIQQPLIAPLYEGKNEMEVLAFLLNRPAQDGHDILQELYGKTWGALGVAVKWRRALNDGLVAESAYPEVPVSPDGGAMGRAWADRKPAPAPTPQALEVVFRPDHCVWDGRWANSGWLQELPDNLTKMVWDNAALMSPATATALGLATGDMVSLEAGGRTLTVAVWVAPGQSDNSITLPLGYGRTVAGRIGEGPGFNAYGIRASNTMHAVQGAKVTRTGDRYELVSTQTHFTMDGRALVREGTLEEYRHNPEFVREMGEEVPKGPTSLYLDREYDFKEGHQWGLTIDLSTCIGCNACTTACQAENNIAIVGKDQVNRGREMHWIRLDRYYVGAMEDPQAVHQPIPCMQCENAPCESVCPVQATAHSDEGLNDMTYNRCIGTRYCNNNCPYKVRRFNFYDWNKGMTEVEKMEKNPDVTVRMRGVMEKCTYCVQRINRAKINAKNQGRPLRDGEIRTACQEVCPTGSIVFGDVNDPESRVTSLKAQDRNYTLLAQLDTRPRTSYLARIRNPNPELETA
jgi:MoCo/4Fe-4S cofactor protein with predicted Tat translocation signal